MHCLYETVVGFRNLCEVKVTEIETLLDKCSSAETFQKEGFSVDRVKSNLTNYSDKDFEVQLYRWYKDPKSSPDCYFFR